MKKIISTAAALGLLAGLATTASAVEFKMSGYYMVEGAYLSDAQAGAGINVVEPAGVDNASDAYWNHTFIVKPTMKVNDKISMGSEMRFADDSVWGNQANGDVATAKGLNSNSEFTLRALYMDYESPIGKFRVGRVPTGTYGTAYRDSDDGRGDRVIWTPNFLSKPLSAMFYFQKVTEQYAINPGSDTDSDAYVARLYYKAEGIDSGLHYQYNNDKTNVGVNDQKQELSAYAKAKMNNFFANAELTYFFGDKETIGVGTRDYDSWAGMLEIGAKIDALTVSGMYFMATGQDPNKTGVNDDMENALGTGGTGRDFEPLYILTGRHTGMLNNDMASPYTNTMSTAGVHGFVAAAKYAVSDKLTLRGAIGYAMADEEQLVGQDDEYGWEYNIGAAYKLLDNLTYEAKAGYLDTGDFFKGANQASNTENVYVLSHSLTMTF
jgi:hypothetical protein